MPLRNPVKIQSRYMILVSGNSGGFWLSQAVSLGCDALLSTPMPLYPLGQMRRD
jgi:hypothetical protein